MTADPSLTSQEIATQPDRWRRAIGEVPAFGSALPRPGERVAMVGCGTSWFMGQAYAALREAAGQGETDAFAASEFPLGRDYDRVVALTRSGTTSEVLALLAELTARTPRTVRVAVTADCRAPVMRAAHHVAVLDYADEKSVVQTRFATSALALLRAALEAHGSPPPGVRLMAEAVTDAEAAIQQPLPEAALTASQWTFLGEGWAYGLACEAALKMREAAGAWTESYPTMEYRHGPISIAAPGRATWVFGPVPAGLSEDLAKTGAALLTGSAGSSTTPPEGQGRPAATLDPMADLVRAQRVAVAVAQARGLDPDQPRHLSRSVILS